MASGSSRKGTDRTGFRIVEVAAPGAPLDAVRGLFLEYGRSLASAACLKGFGAEVAGLPYPYAPPGGCLLLAELGYQPAGCVGAHRLDEARCEMKRLYVRPAFRGAGLAWLLAGALIDRAQALGYREMVLDTMPEMRAARMLYDALGFQPCAPYLPEPTPGADCLALDLTRSIPAG